MSEDINKIPSNSEVAYTYTVHDCEDHRNRVFSITEHYTLDRCHICDKIIKFRWKSWIKRIKSIF